MKIRLKQWVLYLVIFSLGLGAGLVPLTLRRTEVKESVIKPSADASAIYKEINPPGGYQIPGVYGNLGPEMIKGGVIDPAKFRETYDKAGQPLSVEQLQILERGSSEQIVITPENSYFLLNYFWAVGLANQSEILTKGEMVQYGGLKEAGNFASTGGWTLARGPAMKYYAKQKLIPLSSKQEELVKRVSEQMYRPCCNNSTAFPDCNHGMALLGLIELMAAQGATEDQMFEAAKYVNAYWFPGNYYDLALYFKNKEGKNFAQIDARRLMSKEFSSATGAQAVKRWLVTEGIVAEPPKTGGGCGV